MRVKTPTIMQMEAVECGAASLGIILAYYGRIVNLAELRIECGVSRDGSKALNLILAARRYGMIADGFRAEHLEQLQELTPPYIVFWNFNHFLVVEGLSKNWVFLNDPATGPRKVSWQEFDEGFTGVVLVIQPSGNFQKGGRKPRLQGSVGAILSSILVGFLLVIPGLALLVFTQVFVDSILVENRTEWLRPLILGMIITMIFQGVLTLLRLSYLRKLRIKLAVTMSAQFIWHILQIGRALWRHIKLYFQIGRPIICENTSFILNRICQCIYRRRCCLQLCIYRIYQSRFVVKPVGNLKRVRCVYQRVDNVEYIVVQLK